MRAIPICVAVALFASPAAAFEGELHATLSSEQGVAARIRALYSSTGDVRIDIRAPGEDGTPGLATTIMPARGSSYYTVSPAQKVIVEMPYSALANTSQQVKGSGESSNLEVEKLGKETVSGVETRHVRILDRDNDAVIDLWLTDKYPADLWTRAFRGRNIGLEISDDERAKAMKKFGIEPGFAMKMRVLQEGGVPVVFLVERIDRGAVPVSAFALPDGYQRVKGPQAAQP
jgi:hypothetical protein